ncbi:MAG: YaeQ family protein [Lautropia sp.]
MAAPATIHRAQLALADTDRGYYADHALTLARHPSETEERLMVRLLAFAIHAHDDLAFGRGLSTDDEPDLWRRDPTGAIVEWIEVGLPDPKWLRKAASRAGHVVSIAYGPRAAGWWAQQRDALERFEHLTVLLLPPASTASLAGLAARSMQLSITIQQSTAWIADATRSVEVGWTVPKAGIPRG